MSQDPASLRVHFHLAAREQWLEVRAITPHGEEHGESLLPSKDLLNRFTRASEGAIPQATLQSLGFALFQALLAGEAGMLASQALRQGVEHDQPVQFELRFDPDQISLAQYPWEAIADGMGRFLQRDGLVNVVRYLTYPLTGPAIDLAGGQLPLLRVVARPTGLSMIKAVALEGEAVEDIQPATYGRLMQTLIYGRLGADSARNRGLHFDGHGALFVRCRSCAQLNFPSASVCHACNGALDGAQRLGVLAFERPSGNVDWIPAEELGAAIHGTGMSYAVTLASGAPSLTEGLIFNTLASDLVLAGAPAVVGMQSPVTEDFATAFVKSFYQALAEGGNLQAAMQTARSQNRGEGWYSPALTMRYLPVEEKESGIQTIYRSRQIDVAAPEVVAAGEPFQVRLWARRPGGDVLTEGRLRIAFNLPDNVSLLVEPAPMDLEGLESDTPQERRTLRRGKLEARLEAPQAEVAPECAALFVDDRLDAPPAIFTLAAAQAGDLPLRFELWQDDELALSLRLRIQVKEKIEPGRVRLQTRSSTVPVREGDLDAESESLCPDCGMPNRLGVRFCRHCGAELEVPEAFEGAGEGDKGSAPAEPSFDKLPDLSSTAASPPAPGAITAEQSGATICADCGLLNREGVRFCRNCGHPLAKPGEAPDARKGEKQQVVCDDCGRANHTDVRFCRQCGAPLAVAGESVPEEQPAPAPEDAESKPKAVVELEMEAAGKVEARDEAAARVEAPPAAEDKAALAPDEIAVSPVKGRLALNIPTTHELQGLPGAIECGDCGQFNRPEASFCVRCGAPLKAKPPRAVPVPRPPASKPEPAAPTPVAPPEEIAAPPAPAEAPEPAPEEPVAVELTEAPAENYCMKCGFGNPAGAMQCQDCGADLPVTTPSAAAPSPPPIELRAPVVDAPAEAAALCVDCGHENALGAPFCQFCGAPMAGVAQLVAESSPPLAAQAKPPSQPQPPPGLCADCGHQNDPQAPYCKICGAPFASASQVAAPYQPAAAQPPVYSPPPSSEPPLPPPSAMGVAGGTKACPKCGFLNKPDAMVCRGCNSLFDLPDEVIRSKGSTRKGRGAAIFIVAVLLILAALTVAWYLGMI